MTDIEQLPLALHAANEAGWGDQWDAKHQAQISAAARRIGSDPESLAYAMRRADVDHLAELCASLIAAETADELRLALSIFTNNVARQEH